MKTIGIRGLGKFLAKAILTNVWGLKSCYLSDSKDL